jgi:hypothetical protein
VSHEAHDPKAVERSKLFSAPEGSWPAVSRDVAEGEAAVGLVYHDPEGGWWFISSWEPERVPQCLPCLLSQQPELVELADLPLDTVAYRQEEGWERGPRPAEWGPWE